MRILEHINTQRNQYRYILLGVLLTVVQSMRAQEQPAAYPGGSQASYVRVWQATGPDGNSSNFNTTTGIQKARMSTSYFDGLGRPVQTVVKQGSMVTGSSPTDYVSPLVYDNLGRQTLKFIPFASAATNGSFKPDPFQQQATFMGSQYGSQSETYFYGQVKFETSPLSRPTEVYAPGNSWSATSTQANEADRRAVKNKYWTNTLADDVKMWNVTTTQAGGSHPYGLQVSVAVSGSTQTATYTWTNPIPNVSAVSLQYRIPNGSWASSTGSPVSPQNYNMPVGNYEYAITIYFNNGNPSQQVIYTSAPQAAVSLGGVYPAGRLYKNVTFDEVGKQTIDFVDKENKVILKKVRLTAAADNGAGDDHDGWLCTYYLYDEMDNLRCVIQPMGVEWLRQNSWNINAVGSPVLGEQCFRFEYDHRNRMIIKKVPGAGEIWLVYDAWDRLVFSQDANMRLTNKWHAILYDRMSRPVITGMMTFNGTRGGLQQLVTTQTEAMSAGAPGMLTDMVLNTATATATYQALRSITLDPGFETNTGTTVTCEIVTGAGGEDGETTVIDGILVHRNPIPTGADFSYLTKNFYDDHNWTQDVAAEYRTFDNSQVTNLQTPGATFPYPQAVQPTVNTRGSLTGGITKSLDGARAMVTTNFYDEKDRIIQVKSENYTGGCDIATTQYTFFGQPLQSAVNTVKKGGTEQTSLAITRTSFDDLGRIIKVEMKVSHSQVNAGAMPTAWTVISDNQFDAFGRLKNKTLGLKKDGSGNYTTAPLESQAYDYNIRDWLLGVNRSELSTNTPGTKFFGFELGYDKLTNTASKNFTAAQFNGNVGGMIWKSYGDGIRRKYDFSYDGADRFMQAIFEQNNTNGSWNKNEVDFTVKMGDGTTPTQAYDANGNIQRMQQWGLVVTGPAQIDDLDYDYFDYSNKLKKVTDIAGGGTPPSGPGPKLGDFSDKNTTGDDYGYDLNGNKVTDLNKRLNGSTGSSLSSGGAIVYNHLNLPEVVTVKKDDGSPRGSITYVYSASGVKVKKVTVDQTTPGKTITTTSTYIGSLTYESRTTSPADADNPDYADVLQLMTHVEGRIRFVAAKGAAPAKLHYDYFLKDHLNNVRMVLTEEQLQDVYPAATLEGDIGNSSHAAHTENKYYTLDPGRIVNKSEATGIPDYQNNNGNPPYNNNPNSNTTANSAKVFKLAATAGLNGGATGLGVVLKVMGGDKVDIFGKSYWFTANSSETNYSVPASAILSGFINSPGNPAAGKTNSTELNGLAVIAQAVAGFLNDADRNDDDYEARPKAFINYILLDENFRYVDGGFSSVKNTTGIKSHYEDASMQNIPVTKNGYIYVYVSNESAVNVFFDNLQVIHSRGPVLEETHYYPFGLTMAGISSKAHEMQVNKKKYQQYELNSDLDISLYETFFRSHDPQLGRFWQMDPRPNFSESPFAAMGNNPVSNMDPLGDTMMTKRDEKYAKRVEKRINKVNAKLNKKVAKQEKQIAKAEAKGKTQKAADIRKEQSELKERIRINERTLTRLKEISEDQNMAYTFRNNPGEVGGTTKRIVKGPQGNQIAVVMNVVGIENAIHEINHAWQGEIERSIEIRGSGIRFPGNTTREQLEANANAEIEAYRAQYAFNPVGMPVSVLTGAATSLNSITAAYIAGIMQPNTNPPVGLYPNIAELVFSGLFLRIY
jgi:RHS repeat-associated protein